MDIKDSLLDLVGNTPHLRLRRFGSGLPATLVAKCEMFNPYSIKDRAVLSMITQAEARGDIKPGDTLVEATSGNTGMALASIGTQKGYRVVLCMSEIQSVERRAILKALGAELILTPKAGGTKAAKQKAIELQKSLPNAYYIGQHNNPDNLKAHVERTAGEIWEATEGKIDLFVAAMGTCGTVCGVASALKPQKPDLHVVGVEPAEAPILSTGRWQPHRMMGTAPGFEPQILKREVIDEMLPVSEADAFEACRQIAKSEGLLVGISSGANAHAAQQLAQRPENEGKLIVCMFADSGERYLSVEGLFNV